MIVLQRQGKSVPQPWVSAALPQYPQQRLREWKLADAPQPSKNAVCF